MMRRLLVILIVWLTAAIFPAAASAQETPAVPTPILTVTPPSLVPPPYDKFFLWLADSYSGYGPLAVIGGILIAVVVAIVIAYLTGPLASIKKQGEKDFAAFVFAGDLPDIVKRYLSFFIDDEKLLGFRGIAVEGRVFKQLEVNQVYVSICMVPESDPTRISEKTGSDSPESRVDISIASERIEPVELAQVIQKFPKLAIIGAAGCGKSTLLQWAGLACAGYNTIESNISAEQMNFLQAIESRALIPVIIRLRAFHSYCKEKKINLSATALLKFLPEYLNEKHPTLDLPENFFENQLEKSGCLVMFDGVDEVDQDDREAIRQAIEDFVKDFSKNKRNRFLVTSRSSAYFGDAEVGGFHKFWVQNLSPEQRDRLIKNWYEALTPDRAGELTPQLCQLIEESDDRVKRLAVTPLMVTIFAQFYYVDGKLPRSRAELYEHAVATILSGRHRVAGSRLGWETERDYLSYIAHQMHEQNLDDVNEEDLIDLIWSRFGDSAHQKTAREAARHFLDHTTDQGGLLEEQYRRYGFYTHRTFREYLAGRYLAEEMVPSEQKVFLNDHLEKIVGKNQSTWP